MIALLLGAYFSVLGVLALLGLHRLRLTLAAARAPAPAAPPPLGPDAPRVLVQLPLYEEAFVAERLLGAVARLRYPAGRLEVQVLDDSGDGTAALTARQVERLASEGAPVRLLRRGSREGFKAGALAHGLGASDAPLVAIFDADFVPPADFLERTVPHLVADPSLGLVQARWGHLNREARWLTRAQAIFLDGHFSVEHRGRWALGAFFNFNGTAGVWRRAAIDAAGGWRADTITEDLDLSYRAQLAGWRFLYLDDVVAPAELPDRWVAFRQQQARWVRGSVETARLLLGPLLGARGVPWRVRLDGALHLTANLAYLAMAALAVLLPLSVLARDRLGWRVPGGEGLLSALDLVSLAAGTGVMVVSYAAASRRTSGRVRLPEILFALCLGAGMSVGNAREVFRGLRSRGSVFARTPKTGAVSRARAAATYWLPVDLPLAALELTLAAVHLGVAVEALARGLLGPVPFLALHAVGFAAVGLGALREHARGPARARAPAVAVTRGRRG